MTSPIKFFSHTMEGAPQLTNAFGALTTLLDAVLINGFNTKTITSLTRSGTTVTASITAGHAYQLNQIVTIDGATPSDYNGEFRVTSTTANDFTYEVTGSPTTPASGTITSKASPLGWQTAFTGTNKRVYRSLSPLSNKPFLRVDDSKAAAYTTTYAKKAKVTMAVNMTTIDVFQGGYAPYDSSAPTKGEVATGSADAVYDGWFKWYYARAGSNGTDVAEPLEYNRAWFIVGDDRGFYLFNEGSDGGKMGGKCFTDFISYRAGDGFNTILCAQDAYAPASVNQSSWPNAGGEGYLTSDCGVRFTRAGDPVGKLALKGYAQIGAAVPVSFVSLHTVPQGTYNMSGYSTGISFPNGPDYGILLQPTLLKEGTHIRGRMPGMFWVHNNCGDSMSHGELITGVDGYPGRTFMMVHTTASDGYSTPNAFLAFDITGPWW